MNMTCTHGMPSPASCVDCMDEGPVAPPKRWKREGYPFRAGYFGRDCPCGRLVEDGQQIQRWDYGDERSIYTHAGCIPSEGAT